MESARAVLSYDVLVLVFHWIQDDYPSLHACSLVNRAFKEASATYLYGKVTYSPAVSPVLDLKKRDDFLEGFFASARLPHNAALVKRLEISGYLSTRPPPLNKFPGHLKAAVECWSNLNSVVLAPKQYHEDVFKDTLPLLLGLSCLRSLTVNASCTDERHAPTLVQLRNLESLTIQSPTRAILQLLPDWLGALQTTLRILRLTHSCGSVTPGVLRSFIPHLQSVHTFSLGLSYSLTDNDVFEFWEALPSLRTIEHRYYLQLRPSFSPCLPHLRRLVVNYSAVSTKEHTNRLCRWIRRVIAKSSLEELRLVCENEFDGPATSFDPLVEHLTLKHSASLRVLDMPDCFVGIDMLRMLCRTCTALEELGLSISRDALDGFAACASPLQRLHTATFNVRNRKPRIKLSHASAEALIHSAPNLRRLTVDGTRFEGSWVPAPGGEVRFVVEQVQHDPKLFPWERGAVETKERTYHQ